MTDIFILGSHFDLANTVYILCWYFVLYLVQVQEKSVQNNAAGSSENEEITFERKLLILMFLFGRRQTTLFYSYLSHARTGIAFAYRSASMWN